MDGSIPRLSVVNHGGIVLKQAEVWLTVGFVEHLVVVLWCHGVVRTHVNHAARLRQQSLNSTQVGCTTEVAVVAIEVYCHIVSRHSSLVDDHMHSLRTGERTIVGIATIINIARLGCTTVYRGVGEVGSSVLTQ